MSSIISFTVGQAFHALPVMKLAWSAVAALLVSSMSLSDQKLTCLRDKPAAEHTR